MNFSPSPSELLSRSCLALKCAINLIEFPGQCNAFDLQSSNQPSINSRYKNMQPTCQLSLTTTEQLIDKHESTISLAW